MSAHKTPDPAPTGSLPLRVELSAVTYARLEQLATALNVDARTLGAKWIEQGVGAVWRAASLAALVRLPERSRDRDDEAVSEGPATAPGRRVPRVTDDQLVRIARLTTDRVPVTVIAEQLGLSPQTVRRHAHKLRPAVSDRDARISA